MNGRSRYTPGMMPDDIRFRCDECGREYWLALGVSSKPNTSHRTRIGGRVWCDKCVAGRFKKRCNRNGGVLGETVVPVTLSRTID